MYNLIESGNQIVIRGDCCSGSEELHKRGQMKTVAGILSVAALFRYQLCSMLETRSKVSVIENPFIHSRANGYIFEMLGYSTFTTYLSKVDTMIKMIGKAQDLKNYQTTSSASANNALSTIVH